MEERTQEEIEWYFNKFINLIQKMIEEKESLAVQRSDKHVRVEKGRVYWRIFVDEYDEWSGQRSSIFGFVRRKDGAVLRAATYKAPETRTKSAVRRYVYDDHPQNYFTQFGIVYAEEP